MKALSTLARRSRPPLERMMRIHEAIRSGDYPNATTLAGILEVSTKSIQRDLEFMRDRLNLPLEYSPRRNGYHYTQEVSAFPTLQITEGELFALLIAEKALQLYRGTHFERPLVSAFRKLCSSLPDSISLHLADWEQAVSFRNRAEPVFNLEVFDAVAQATARCQQIEITYRKPGRRDTEQRLVDPWHLGNINGEWFLFAHDHLRKDLRTFLPARIQAVRLTGKTFVRPRKFSIENRLHGSFGVHSGHGEYKVVVRFDRRVADYIREKKWHPTQQLRNLQDGGVELQLQLSSLVEIERWVLSWGGNARVIEPRELTEAIQESARRILESSEPDAPQP
jgi:proteasome accessory factor B